MTRDAHGGAPRVAAVVLAIVLLTIAATLLRPPPARGPFARDFEAYVAAGAAWDAGGDPYSRQIWIYERRIPGVESRREELLPFVGPAAALPLFGALARLPHAIAVQLWTALLGIALVVTALASAALASTGSGPTRSTRARRIGIALAAIVVVAAAAPATSGLALGQAALIAAAGVACAMLALERNRRFALGAAAMLVAALQPNLALALVARIRDRAAASAAAIALAIFVLLTLTFGGGVSGLAAYARLLGEHGRAERFDLIQFTPAAIAWSWGASWEVAFTIGIVIALVAIAGLIGVTLQRKLDARDGTLLAIALLPFAVPFFHEHDFAIELIPLIIAASILRGRSRAAVGIAAGLILVDWLALAQRLPAQPALVLQGLAAACAIAGLGVSPRLQRSDLAAPIAVVIALLVALPLARAFPAPVWPDALPLGYHAPAALDASGAWHDEQRVAGLLAQHPAWGVLRALPLAGCLILAGTIAGGRLRYRRS